MAELSMPPKHRGQDLGGRYRSQPVDPVTGRRMSFRAGTLAELESRMTRVDHVRDAVKYGDITVREAQGRLRTGQGLNVQVAELWKRYARGVPRASERIAESTWRRLLEPWFGGCAVWDLTETKMREWLTDLERARRPGGKRGYAPKTRRAAYDFLRAAINLALRDGTISEYPWGTFTVANPKFPEKEREALRDPAELLALLAAARDYDQKHHTFPEGRFEAILFLALTGLRQAEAAGLAWSDVDLERLPAVLRVRRQAVRGWPRIEGGGPGARPVARPKNGPRDQELHPNALQALRVRRAFLQGKGLYSEEGPVFPKPGTAKWRTSGRILSPAALRDTVTRAGLPNVESWVPHSLRHSFARLELVGHGGDLRTVALRTGHKDLSVLEGYLRKPSRQAGASRIPELPPGLSSSPILDAPEGAPLLEVGAPARTVGALLPPHEPARPLEETLPENTWTDQARAWLAGGQKPKIRPRIVTREIKAIYSLAYKRALYAGKSKEDARKEAARARRGALGAWGLALSRAKSFTEPPF